MRAREDMHVPTSSKDEQERPPLRRLAERYFVKLNSFGQKKLLCLCTEGTPVPSEDCYLSHGKLLAYIRREKYPPTYRVCPAWERDALCTSSLTTPYNVTTAMPAYMAITLEHFVGYMNETEV